MPKLEEYFLPAMDLVGLSTTTPSSMTAEFPVTDAIRLLWDEVLELTGVNPRTTLRFGLLHLLDDGLIEYHACLRTNDYQGSGLSPFSFAGGYYICAEHEGDVATLPNSLRWFYGEYLPSSGYTLRPGWHIEMFDARFVPNAADSIMTFGAPAIRPAGQR